MMQSEMELMLPTIRDALSKTPLTLDIVDKITGDLLYEIIKAKCSEWINDPDTTIGMECNWLDLLVAELPLDFTKEQIALALNAIQTEDDDIPCRNIKVKHEQYGLQDLSIAIFEKRIIISTKRWLLREYCYEC